MTIYRSSNFISTIIFLKIIECVTKWKPPFPEGETVDFISTILKVILKYVKYSNVFSIFFQYFLFIE